MTERESGKANIDKNNFRNLVLKKSIGQKVKKRKLKKKRQQNIKK